MAAGYKINEHKSMALVYTNSSVAEKEFIRTVPFKRAGKNPKYLRINLTKDVELLLMKQLVSWIRKIPTVPNNWFVDSAYLVYMCWPLSLSATWIFPGWSL